MADAIRRLAGDRDLATRMGAAGAVYVSTHYDRTVLAERFVTIVEGTDHTPPSPRHLGGL
jgi:hypothetical protein